MEKLPKLERKVKNLEESFVNISEISSHLHESPGLSDFTENPKSKLKFQLEQMCNAVTNMQNKYQPEQVTSIKGVENMNNRRQAEDSSIKGEVENLGSKIYEIKNNLQMLIEKVSKVEEDAKKNQNKKRIEEFKKDIVDEIQKRKKTTVRSNHSALVDMQNSLENTSESKASEILSMIHIKTEAKLRKIRQLQAEKIKNSQLYK